MERFKVCERETKTKAFSIEGLSAAEKADPEEIKRQEARDWINGILEELQLFVRARVDWRGCDAAFMNCLAPQVDSCEAEMENLDTGSKKKKKGDDTAVQEVRDKVAQHMWHIEKLEGVLRGIDNENITPEQVEEIKDDIQYYIESHDVRSKVGYVANL
jgi:CCR4-NOT transcription complex subunit 3